ncbi:TPA: phage tail tape measure protein [Klebsiella aerogenes]|nr:phage tail tape measure protein [Klebsiella aerogenes]
MKNLSIRVAFSAIDKLTRPITAARKSAGGLSDSLKSTQSAIKGIESQSRTFNRLRDSVQKSSRSIANARQTLDGLNRSQREGAQLTDKQRAHMASLAAKIDRLSAVQAKEIVRLKAASQALRTYGVSLVGGDRTIQSAIRRTEQYNQSLERQRQRLAAVTQAQARHDQMQQTAGKLRGSSTMALAGATAAGYAGGRFLSPAIGFDREMSRVQALTRIDKSSASFTALREQAKKLGAETQFTSTDAASGQAFLAMAGFTPQAIQAALPGVLNMALAGGMDLGESADISSNILSQFRLDPKEMDRVSDVLTGAFTRTNTGLQDIGEAMKYAGTGMANLGVDVEQTTAMIGVMANVGLRGSIAGTGLQATFSRLAAPTGRAKDAIKELGVQVADASGKMRPAEAVLSDLYKQISKYGDVDRLSFFKDIAGEEAAKSFQALVMSAGSGELQKLLSELRGAKGEAQKAAKVMADNLDGDLKNLDSAWEGFRIQISDLVKGEMRELVQGLSNVVGAMTQWAKENPKLTQALLVTGGSVLALTAAIGGTSLAVGLLMGPLAKLQLGFSLLTGGRGIGGAITLFRSLGTASGPALARLGGWRVVFGSALTSMRQITGIMPALRAGMMGAFMAPGAAVASLTRSLGMLLLRLTGIPAIFGLIKTVIMGLGGAFSFLLSPIGLIGLALAGAALLIWKYWEPIKAFFGGFFSGLMSALAPLRESFAQFSPLFDALGRGLSEVFNWFKSLLTPMESSKDTLDKCASAGATFGSVLGGALQLVLAPAKALLDTLAWILEKLGVLPDAAERARKKIEDAQRMALLQDKVSTLQGDLVKVAPKKVEVASAPKPTSPLTGDSGTVRRLKNIDTNTKATADNTKKRIGPGDIVFKNLPQALAVRGQWMESHLAGKAGRGGIVSPGPAVMAAASQPVRQAALPPVRRSDAGTGAPSAAGGFTGDININLHGVERQDARELARIVAEAVRAELSRRDRLNRGSFRDRD